MKSDEDIPIEFKDKWVFAIYHGKPRIYNIGKHDWRSYIFNDNMKISNNIVDNLDMNSQKLKENNKNDKNIFVNMDRKLQNLNPSEQKNKMKFIEENFIPHIKNHIPNPPIHDDEVDDIEKLISKIKDRNSATLNPAIQDEVGLFEKCKNYFSANIEMKNKELLNGLIIY